MNFQYNRKLATVVLVVCALTSVFGLGGVGLARERKDALRVFEEGVDTSFAVRFSVEAYLQNSADYAAVMAEEVRMRVDAESESAQNVQALAETVRNGGATAQTRAAYRDLVSAVETMYSEFHSAVADEASCADFDRAYTNFASEKNKIGFDEYNPTARTFNELRGEFPARWVAGLFGVGELETFD